MIFVGVTGHQAIPDNVLVFVKNGIAKVLRDLDNELVGVSSLAAGSDQLFAQAVLDMGGHLHVIIPCEQYSSAFEDKRALEQFRYLVSHAREIETLEHAQPSEQAFLEAGRRVVELSKVMVAVWDGQEARGKGGTADIVAYARERGLEPVVIWPSGLAR